MPQQDVWRQILDNVCCSIRNTGGNAQLVPLKSKERKTGQEVKEQRKEPGVYKAEKLGDKQYVLVKPTGHIYVFSFPGPSLGTTTQDLWPGICLYQPQSKTEIIENIRGSEIVKILPEREFQRVTQPRPFSVCLAGEYGGRSGDMNYIGQCRFDYSDFGPEYADLSRDADLALDRLLRRFAIYEDVRWRLHQVDVEEGVKVLPDGSVLWTPAHFDLIDAQPLGDELYDYQEVGTTRETIVFQVESVTRSDEWTVQLHAGQEPHLEVIYPPLSCLKMTNGKTVDLSKLGFSTQSALLSSTRISFRGNIKETEGSDCIVSFPGRYADGWRECVQASSHDMGVACVFLCGKDDGFGQHAIDPDADGTTCYCHKIYGEKRHFKTFGHESEEKCKANGNRPTWGCLWFEKWRNNVEAAVKKKQRLIAYFFMGQVGRGLVAWDDLATAELWNGDGLGGSQKGELAFLQKQNYDFVMRDVREFVEGFSKESMRI